MDNLWKLGDEFRGQSKISEDDQWSVMTSKLAELTRSNFERMIDMDYLRNVVEMKLSDKVGYREDAMFEGVNRGLMNLDPRVNEVLIKNPFHGTYNKNTVYQQGNTYNPNSFKSNTGANKRVNKEDNNGGSSNNGNTKTITSAVDRQFKTLPSTEMLPRNETLGGYIFVCNNDTMQEDLRRQLFGLPPRYCDSVRAITPGLPLFLYNYTTHQLHGIFEAASFGGSNIDPTAWQDKKFKGESRFPSQVRIRVRKICKPLEEDEFRPVLHHYDGPKFRLELSIIETLKLLDLCKQGGL